MVAATPDPSFASGPIGDPLLGQVIGRYRLLRFIGSGKVGAVYAAWDDELGRKIALKLIPRLEDSAWADLSSAVRNEARAAAALDHENIVRIYEVGQQGGWHFIAMELIEGHNLKQLIASNGAFDLVRGCQIMADVAEALAYAHREGILHRDIKPANLILTRSGRCKVTDFGLAAAHPAESAEGQEHLRVGTASYMAPEVEAGYAAKPVADVFSFGATLWHLLTGAPPYAGAQMATADPKLPRLSELRPDVPEALAGVIQQTLELDPGRRWSDLDDLVRLLRVHSIPLDTVAAASPEGRRFARALEALIDRRAKPLRVRALIAGLMLAALVAVLAGFGAVAGLYQIERTQRRSAVSQLNGEPSEAALFREFVEADRLRGLNWLGQDVGLVTSPGDIDTLRRLSIEDPGRVVGIEGRVLELSVAANGKVGRLILTDLARHATFDCVFFPETFDAMRDAFGAFDADRITGRRIFVKGQVTQYQGAPQIIVTSPTQVVLLPSALEGLRSSQPAPPLSPAETRPTLATHEPPRLRFPHPEANHP